MVDQNEILQRYTSIYGRDDTPFNCGMLYVLAGPEMTEGITYGPDGEETGRKRSLDILEPDEDEVDDLRQVSFPDLRFPNAMNPEPGKKIAKSFGIDVRRPPLAPDAHWCCVTRGRFMCELAHVGKIVRKYLSDAEGWTLAAAEILNGSADYPNLLLDVRAIDGYKNTVFAMIIRVISGKGTDWNRLMFDLAYSPQFLKPVCLMAMNIDGPNVLGGLPWAPVEGFWKAKAGAFQRHGAFVTSQDLVGLLTASAFAPFVSTFSSWNVEIFTVLGFGSASFCLPKKIEDSYLYHYMLMALDCAKGSLKKPVLTGSFGQGFEQYAKLNGLTAAADDNSIPNNNGHSSEPAEWRPSASSSHQRESAKPQQAATAPPPLRAGFLLGGGRPKKKTNKATNIQVHSSSSVQSNGESSSGSDESAKGSAYKEQPAKKDAKVIKNHVVYGPPRTADDELSILEKYNQVYGTDTVPFHCGITHILTLSKFKPFVFEGPHTASEEPDSLFSPSVFRDVRTMTQDSLAQFLAPILHYSFGISKDLFDRLDHDQMVVLRFLAFSWLLASLCPAVCEAIPDRSKWRAIRARLVAGQEPGTVPVEACLALILGNTSIVAMHPHLHWASILRANCAFPQADQFEFAGSTSPDVWDALLAEAPWSASLWLAQSRALYRQARGNRRTPTLRGTQQQPIIASIEAFIQACILVPICGIYTGWDFADATPGLFQPDQLAYPMKPRGALFSHAWIFKGAELALELANSHLASVLRDQELLSKQRRNERAMNLDATFRRYKNAYGQDMRPFYCGMLYIFGAPETPQDYLDRKIVRGAGPNDMFKDLVAESMAFRLGNFPRREMKMVVHHRLGISLDLLARMDVKDLRLLAYDLCNLQMAIMVDAVKQSLIDWTGMGSDGELTSEMLGDYLIIRAEEILVSVVARVADYPKIDWAKTLQRKCQCTSAESVTPDMSMGWPLLLSNFPWNPAVHLLYARHLNRVQSSSVKSLIAYQKACILLKVGAGEFSNWNFLGVSVNTFTRQNFPAIHGGDEYLKATIFQAGLEKAVHFVTISASTKRSVTQQDPSSCIPKTKNVATNKGKQPPKGAAKKKKKGRQNNNAWVSGADHARQGDALVEAPQPEDEEASTYEPGLPAEDRELLAKAGAYVKFAEYASDPHQKCENLQKAANIYNNISDKYGGGKGKKQYSAHFLPQLYVSHIFAVMWNTEVLAKERVCIKATVDQLDRIWDSPCRPLLLLFQLRLNFLQRNFEEAEAQAHTLRRLLESGAMFSPVVCPSTDTYLLVSTRAGLFRELLDVEYELVNRDRPDQTCSASSCSHPRIFYNSPDFAGYRKLGCTEKCTLAYHNDCLNRVLGSVGAREMKDVRSAAHDFPCPTPDCAGAISSIEVYKPDTRLKTTFTRPDRPVDVKILAREIEQPKLDDNGEGEAEKNGIHHCPLHNDVQEGALDVSSPEGGTDENPEICYHCHGEKPTAPPTNPEQVPPASSTTSGLLLAQTRTIQGMANSVVNEDGVSFGPGISRLTGKPKIKVRLRKRPTVVDDANGNTSTASSDAPRMDQN